MTATTKSLSFSASSGERRFAGSLYGFAAIQVVAAYGVAGYLSMGWTFIDALYQVVITISGVGFDEVEPMTSTGSRVFTDVA